jgi:hypothetical protein
MNYLVETKTEYTIQLTNILVPLIYEGISSIYDDAIKIAHQDEELKTFQIFLKKIPKWNNNLLENETNRILCMSTCPELLKNLVNAVVKANIMILTNTHPSDKSLLKINTNFDFKEFIHNCYIESARIFYNNPFLFYHKHSIYDINRNQKDAKENIRNAIIEAIRKMLPLKMIINEYLGNSFKDDSNVNIDIDINVTLSEAEKHNLKTMIEIDNTKNEDFVKIPDKLETKKQEEEEEEKVIQVTERKLEREIQVSENKLERKTEQELKLKRESINSLKKSELNLDSLKKSELELQHKLELKFDSLKKSDKKTNNKKHIEDDCESISYYKNDAKHKVEDSFSNSNNNINTQQIFFNKYSVELTEDALISGKNKPININNTKVRKFINY